MNKIKLGLMAVGLSTALAAGSAAASINWNYDGTTLFEDDDIDFIWTVDGNGDLVADLDGRIDVGDILISITEFHDANGSSILPQELTGVVAGQVATVTPISGALASFTFQPYEGGLNEILALGTGGVTVGADGAAGGGAIAALYLSNDPNLDIAADDITGGTVSCTTLSQCIDQAVDGSMWEVDGWTGGFEEDDNGDLVWVSVDKDEFWTAPVGQVFTAVPLATEPAIELSSFNGGASILQNGTGQDSEYNSISCFPFCGAGGDGFVDVIVGGSIKGGLGLTGTLIADGAFASSDMDLQKRAIPEPGTLALLATGLMGMGAVQRRRRKAKASKV